MTPAQLNQAYLNLGVDVRFAHREGAGTTLTESLGLHAVTGGAYGSDVTWSSANLPENAQTGNRVSLPGSGNGFINLGNIGGTFSRGGANNGWTLSTFMRTSATTFVMGFSDTNDACQFVWQNAGYNYLTYRIASQGISNANTIAGKRNVAAGFPFHDGQWHHLALVYHHAQGYLDIYYDGERWWRFAGGVLAAFQAKALTDPSAFLLGACSYNGVPGNQIASSFAETTATSRPMGPEEVRTLYQLASMAYPSAMTLPSLVGPQASTVAASLRSRLLTGSPIIIGEGDSTCVPYANGVHVWSGFAREISRQINMASGGRLANIPLVFSAGGGDDDSASPPGLVTAFTSGQTYRLGFSTSMGETSLAGASNQLYYAGLGPTIGQRHANVLDTSAGLRFDLYAPKVAAQPAGAVTVNIYGSSFEAATYATSGDATWFEKIATTSIPAANFVGTAGTHFVAASITCTAAKRYRAFVLEIIFPATAMRLNFCNVISLANVSGPQFIMSGLGGSTNADFRTTYVGRMDLYRVMGATDFIDFHGLNDSVQYTVPQMVTNATAYAVQIRTTFPNASIFFVPGHPKALMTNDAGSGLTSMISNARMESFPGAMGEHLAANPSEQTCVVNHWRHLIRCGWTPQTQTLLGGRYEADDSESIAAAWNAATAYAGGAILQITGTNGNYTYVAMGGLAAGTPPTDGNGFLRVSEYLDAGTHLSPDIGQTRKAAIVGMTLLAGAGSAALRASGGGLSLGL